MAKRENMKKYNGAIAEWDKHPRNGRVQQGLQDEYNIYVACADDGNGVDITTGQPLKTFDEWLNS